MSKIFHTEKQIEFLFYIHWCDIPKVDELNYLGEGSMEVREWLLFNANSAIFQFLSLREKVNFQWDDDEVRFVLDQHAELELYSASSLKQHVAPLGHIILIPSQPVFTLSP